MTPSDGKSQQYDSKSSLASKKMRMTLACVRCRSKKVKCDTKHPSCTRCFQAKVSCSYEGSSSQIDIYNLIKLNDTVDTLQKRIQYLESTIGDIQHTTPNSIASPAEDAAGASSMVSPNSEDITPITPQGSKSASQHSHQWSLSLTSTGLRIDTNIVTIPNLYNILLSGVSQLDLNQQNTGSSPLHYSRTAHPSQQNEQPSEVDIADKSVMVQPKTPLWRSKMTTFPLYSTWSSDSLPKQSQHSSFTDRRHLHHKWPHQETTPVASALDTMIDIYCECFLCLPDTGYGGTIDERYRQGTLDPLLTNAIFAWSARHGAIYHDLYKGQDPNQVGECYFNVAKDLLKDRFTIPSIDTLHGVLILYIYAIGRPSKHEHPQQSTSTTPASEAYLFLGLAIRMCLDLKLHKERKDDDETSQPIEMERDRRFFWVLYFLETLCTLHSDRPFSLPSKDQITVAYPDVLGNETGERRWRTEFMMKRFRITRIYRDIIQRTSQSAPLPLSCISELDADLCDWYDQLPSYMQYQQGDWRQRKWKSTSFREQACIKLNLEYHFQRCQLYAVFLKRKQDDKEEGDGDPFYGPSNHPDGNDNSDQGNEDEGTSTAMETKAKNVCVTSATMTVELMQCWNQLQQRWCHFSLESLMMAVNIFEMLLRDDDVEQTKAHLTTVLNILQASPIQHHRHVIIVTTRIQKLLHMKSGNNGSDSDWVPRSDIGTTGIGSDEISNLQQQQQQLGATSVFIQHSIDMYNSFLPTQLSNGMMGVHYGDLPFSDFLYNPVMQLPPSSFGPYTTSIQQQQQQQWDASQPPSITTQLPLAQTYSPTPSTTVVALSPTYSVPPSDDYSTRSSAVSAASLWTTTLHQPTYASNGSAIFESLSLQDRHPSNQQLDPANGHPPPQHTSPYSSKQR